MDGITPWVMTWTAGSQMTTDADDNPLDTPVDHDTIIANFITSDGSDDWDSGTIHDSVFSYTQSGSAGTDLTYNRILVQKKSDALAQFKVGYKTIFSYTWLTGASTQTYEVTRTLEN